MVLVCLAASRATLALKAAECRLRLPVMTHLGMDQRSLISITSRVVQFQGSTQRIVEFLSRRTDNASLRLVAEATHLRVWRLCLALPLLCRKRDCGEARWET